MKSLKLVILSILALSSLPITACYTDKIDKDGTNIIHNAVDKDSIKSGMLQITLESCSQEDKEKYINAVDNMNATPLFYALIDKNYSAIKILLAHGANPNLLTKIPHIISNKYSTEKLTPLHIAVIFEDETATEILLDNNANVDSPASNKKPPLLLAIAQRSNNVAKLLLSRGANPNYNYKGASPLRIALEYNLPFAFTLLGYGAKPNNGERRLLRIDCQNLLLDTIEKSDSEGFNATINTMLNYKLISLEELKHLIAHKFVDEGIIEKKQPKLSNKQK